MPVRPAIDTATSHYTVLGVSRGATADQIKQAYRHKAKAAHPDAGGSAAAMERINAAYAVLGDPARRLSYDADQLVEANAMRGSHTQGYTTRATSAQEHYDAAADHATAQREHIRRRWARSSALEIARVSLLFVAGLTVLTLYVAPRLPTPPPFYGLFLIIIIPLFTMLFGVAAFIDPRLRLAIYDFSPRYRIYPTKREWRVARRLLAFAVVLAIIWAWMISSS